MGYYAHTATLTDGKPDLNELSWRGLSAQLRYVAQLVEEFAAGENEKAPSSVSARGRVKEAQHSALFKYCRNFDQSAIAFRVAPRPSIRRILSRICNPLHVADSRALGNSGRLQVAEYNRLKACLRGPQLNVLD